MTSNKKKVFSELKYSDYKKIKADNTELSDSEIEQLMLIDNHHEEATRGNFRLKTIFNIIASSSAVVLTTAIIGIVYFAVGPITTISVIGGILFSIAYYWWIRYASLKWHKEHVRNLIKDSANRKHR